MCVCVGLVIFFLPSWEQINPFSSLCPAKQGCTYIREKSICFEPFDLQSPHHTHTHTHALKLVYFLLPLSVVGSLALADLSGFLHISICYLLSSITKRRCAKTINRQEKETNKIEKLTTKTRIAAKCMCWCVCILHPEHAHTNNVGWLVVWLAGWLLNVKMETDFWELHNFLLRSSLHFSIFEQCPMSVCMFVYLLFLTFVCVCVRLPFIYES